MRRLSKKTLFQVINSSTNCTTKTKNTIQSFELPTIIISHKTNYHEQTLTLAPKLHKEQRRTFSIQSTDSNHSDKKSWWSPFFLGGLGLIFGGIAFSFQKATKCEQEEQEEQKEGQQQQQHLPTYSRHDVAKHKTAEDGIWVVYKDKVYDITDFVNAHPGGVEKIMLAAGSSIEPFWLMFQMHNKEEIRDILKQFLIGYLDEESQQYFSELIKHDPYINDPERHPSLVIRSLKPMNAEPPLDSLVENFLTPNELFYVRNHLPVPKIDPENYTLEISGNGIAQPITLTLEDLKTKFPKHTVITAIQCAGNRRSDISKVKLVKGLDWGAGAISNASWTGVRLVDVLNYVGWNPNQKGQESEHIWFEGLDQDITNKKYGGSIPISVLTPDVILAYEMNGEELPRDHGFPIRAVCPGIVGARNVKWLGKVITSSTESPAFWQQGDYKGFSPSTDWDTVDFKSAPAIQELPVTSAICQTEVSEDKKEITVKGYAYSGGGRGIIRVDVTIDGKNWIVANLCDKPDQTYNRVYAWTLWTIKIPVPENSKEVIVMAKAVDSSYNVQPEGPAPIWNLRGVLSNSWHKVKVDIDIEE